MTIVFNPSDLLAGLKRIKGIIPKDPVLPILADFHFAVYGDYVTVTASNLEITASVDIMTTMPIEGTGDFTIEAAPLLKLIEAAEIEPLIVEIAFGDNQHAAFTTKQGNYKLPISNADDYPEIPNYSTSDEYFHTTRHILLPMFEKVAYALSKDELRPAMTCVRNVIQLSGIADVTATDAHRLGNAWHNRFAVDPEDGTSEVYSVYESSIEILWTPQAVKLLPKFMGDGIYKIMKNDRQIFVAARDGFFCFQQVDAKYPDTRGLFPEMPLRIENVRIEDLRRVLSRMIVVAPALTHTVRLTFNKHLLILMAEDFDNSKSGTEKIELMEEIDAETGKVMVKTSPTMTVHVNIKSLAEALDNLQYQEGIVQFGINGASRPLTMRSLEEVNGEEATERHLLMPINPGTAE